MKSPTAFIWAWLTEVPMKSIRQIPYSELSDQLPVSDELTNNIKQKCPVHLMREDLVLYRKWQPPEAIIKGPWSRQGGYFMHNEILASGIVCWKTRAVSLYQGKEWNHWEMMYSLKIICCSIKQIYIWAFILNCPWPSGDGVVDVRIELRVPVIVISMQTKCASCQLLHRYA